MSLYKQATSLLRQGLPVQLVAQRLGVSKDWVCTVARVTGQTPPDGAPPDLAAVAGIGNAWQAAAPASPGCQGCSLRSLCTTPEARSRPEPRRRPS